MQVFPSDFLKIELKGIPPVQLLNWGIVFLPAEGHHTTFTMKAPLARKKQTGSEPRDFPLY